MTSTCYLQNIDSIKKQTLYIKYNLPLTLTGESFLSVEKCINNSKHFETGLGIIYPFRPWYNSGFLIYYYGEKTYSFYHGTGVDFRTQYKIDKKNNSYFSILFLFKYIWKNRVLIQYPKFEHNYYAHNSIESDKTNVTGLEFLYGKRHFFLKRIFTDVYTGVGIRVRDTYDGSFHILKLKGFDFGDNQYDGKIYIIPTFHFGVSLGYNLIK